jgi:hypothetical protein
MVARATRVDPHAGPYAGQRAQVFHPDDPLFARFRWRMEREQGSKAAGTTCTCSKAISASAGRQGSALTGGRRWEGRPRPGDVAKRGQ